MHIFQEWPHALASERVHPRLWEVQKKGEFDNPRGALRLATRPAIPLLSIHYIALSPEGYSSRRSRPSRPAANYIEKSVQVYHHFRCRRSLNPIDYTVDSVDYQVQLMRHFPGPGQAV
jgi:hypothetical protein